MNLDVFVRKYTVVPRGKGKNKIQSRDPKKVAFQFHPDYAPDEQSKDYPLYCHMQLLCYKPWAGSRDNLWPGFEGIEEYFHNSDNTQPWFNYLVSSWTTFWDENPYLSRNVSAIAREQLISRSIHGNALQPQFVVPVDPLVEYGDSDDTSHDEDVVIWKTFYHLTKLSIFLMTSTWYGRTGESRAISFDPWWLKFPQHRRLDECGGNIINWLLIDSCSSRTLISNEDLLTDISWGSRVRFHSGWNDSAGNSKSHLLSFWRMGNWGPLGSPNKKKTT